jgi:hypothetical protein
LAYVPSATEDLSMENDRVKVETIPESDLSTADKMQLQEGLVIEDTDDDSDESEEESEESEENEEEEEGEEGEDGEEGEEGEEEAEEGEEEAEASAEKLKK